MPHSAFPKLPLALLAGMILLSACGEAIPGTPGAPGSPEIPERHVIAQSNETRGARVLRDRGVLVVETHGTMFQAGVQQGTLLRERLRDQIRDYHERRAFPAFSLMPGFVHRFYARRQARHMTLDERDFVRGLSMGSGVSHDEMLLLSADAPYTTFSKRLPGLLPGGGSFVARGKASREGRPLVGRVSDDLALGIRQRFDMLWVHRPEKGPAWVALTRVGSLAAEAAWSETGLYASIDPLPGWPVTAGLPPRWLTLRLMSAESPDAAEAEIRKLAPRTSQAFVGTLVRGEGARIVEAAGSQVGVRSYGSGAALSDLAQSLGTFKAQGMGVTSGGARDERLGKLLASSYGQLDASRAQAILTDIIDPRSGQRGPGAESISRSLPVRLALGPLVLGDWGEQTTTSAMIAEPLDDRLWVALGQEKLDAPANFVPFRLSQLFSGEASRSLDPH